ncbi:MAG: DNA mismatch repair protein MutL, partial [Spirochaetia bacterium]|nr:DNA mismatch repair protein MutL [Spirochaetia bacterium]
EVKLRNKAEIHHQIVTMIGKNIKRTIPSMIQNTDDDTPFLPMVDEKRTTYAPTHKNIASGRTVHEPQEQKPIDQQWFQKAKEILQGSEFEASRASNEEDIWNDQMQDDNFSYLGQAFNLFLIAEKQDELFLVDQHAAHERILYDEVRSKQSVQKLMIPLVFEVERDVDDYLREHQDVYLNVGISLERTDDLVWELQGIPALYKSVEQQLVSFIQHNTGNIEEVQKGLYAIVACHAAIKAGDTVDRMSAIALLKKVFALEEPICPHGRTFVVRLSKPELLKAVQRT